MKALLKIGVIIGEDVSLKLLHEGLIYLQDKQNEGIVKRTRIFSNALLDKRGIFTNLFTNGNMVEVWLIDLRIAGMCDDYLRYTMCGGKTGIIGVSFPDFEPSEVAMTSKLLKGTGVILLPTHATSFLGACQYAVKHSPLPTWKERKTSLSKLMELEEAIELAR